METTHTNNEGVIIRKIKVYYGYKKKSYKRIPVIRLSGDYLKQAGFEVGDMIMVTLDHNRISISIIPKTVN